MRGCAFVISFLIGSSSSKVASSVMSKTRMKAFPVSMNVCRSGAYLVGGREGAGPGVQGRDGEMGKEREITGSTGG